MPKFVTSRDARLFNIISEELVEDIVNTPIDYYKMITEDLEVNLYGESVGKTYYLPILIDCLMAREDETTTNTDFGTDSVQNVSFAFQRQRLESKNIYPEVGDVISWNNGYYEIHNVNENQLIAGRTDLNYAIVCQSHMVRRSKVQIENVRFGDNS